MLYVDKRILAYCLASAVIGLCVFLFLLIHYGWWFIIDDNNISGGYFAVLGDVTKFWVGFLKLFLMSILVMLIHIIVFDGPSSKREKWRFALRNV